MASIKIKFRDGTEREFRHTGRAGGSYTKSVRYEGSFVVVRDEWDNENAFPQEIVAEVITNAEQRGGW